MALKGDTIRLSVRFLDVFEEKVDPDEVYLNIYDNSNIAIQSIPLTEDNKVDVGEYFYDYVIPYTVNDFIVYEFSGNHRGRPILSRERISISFSWCDYRWLCLN